MRYIGRYIQSGVFKVYFKIETIAVLGGALVSQAFSENNSYLTTAFK